jgi:hypothetical protein
MHLKWHKLSAEKRARSGALKFDQRPLQENALARLIAEYSFQTPRSFRVKHRGE